MSLHVALSNNTTKHNLNNTTWAQVHLQSLDKDIYVVLIA
jgi:hypothetical protein